MKTSSNQLPSKEIDYLKIARILLNQWHWIIGSVLINVMIAHAYLWYTPKKYTTEGILKFEDKKSEMSDLISIMSNSGRRQTNLQTEKVILQSHTLLQNAIRKISYPVSFFISENLLRPELYPHQPLKIQILKFDPLSEQNGFIKFEPIDYKSFRLSWTQAEKKIVKNFRYNQSIHIGAIVFSIRHTKIINTNTAYLFKFNTYPELLDRIRNGLHLNEETKPSNIIVLKQTDTNPVFAKDILNAIMDEYLNYDQDQKTQSASQMITFIDKQLRYLSNEVNNAEESLEKYKRHSGMIDLNASTGQVFAKVSQVDAQLSLLKIQRMAIDQLKDQIMKEQGEVHLNFNLEGSIDPLLSNLIIGLNKLLTDRNMLLKVYNIGSNSVEDINRQITQFRTAALQNVNASHHRILKNIAHLNAQLRQANQEISRLPAAEKNMLGLRRNFEISEKVYAFLSEKKLEALVNRSAILPGATIIEPAMHNPTPISPRENEVYQTAVVLGLLNGIALIILIRVLNPYIYEKDFVERITSIPIIGLFRKFPGPIDENSSQILALSSPRSIFSESVRAVRTNLNFLASDKENKVICITSEISGEGKSFTAINLATTLALIDKKVILISADLRRPKLHKTFGSRNERGLSNYLVNECSLVQIIRETGYKNLDFINSGPIPPNPSELLHSQRMSDLLDELKKTYQVILMDTAPIGLVSDSIPLIRWSDINLFVIRYGKSKHQAATLPERIANEYDLSNVLILLNAFEKNLLHSEFYRDKGSYGSHYTDYNYKNSPYYLNEQQKKWWHI